MKIAIMSTGSTNDRKGVFNSVHDRNKHIRDMEGYEIDTFLIRHYDDWIFRLLRNKEERREDVTIVDGVKYNNLWVKHRMIDYILTSRLKMKDISCKSQLHRFVPLFKNYDLLSVHSLPDMYIAYLVKLEYGIPFVTTWHGSDINVWPFVNKEGFKTTKMMMENADYNFFVSKKLMQVSDKISSTKKKSHLYTGPSDVFIRSRAKEKSELRKKLNIQTKYLIGFVGNIVAIKNVLVLPEIFSSINRSIDDMSFIIVGNGKLSEELKDRMTKRGVTNVAYTGKVDPEKIPEIMNCLDILILPSFNEGLPLVVLEAMASGVHVTGSNMGGIPEAIGKENSFELDDNFVTNISNRIIEIIENNESPKPLSDEFSWDKTLEKEMEIYNSILDDKTSPLP